jgi:hypothetical protein
MKVREFDSDSENISIIIIASIVIKIQEQKV